MRTTNRVLAILMTLCLSLSSVSYAAETNSTTAQRQEDLDYLLNTLAETHPNMYANTTQQAVAEKKAYIEQNMKAWDDFTFSVELQTLLAMLKDSHTQLSIDGNADSLRLLPIDLQWWDGAWYLTACVATQKGYLGWEVTAINGKSMTAVQEALSPFFSADNEIRARRSFSQSVYIWELLTHFGVVESDQEQAILSLRNSDGQKIELPLKPMTRVEIQQMETDSLQSQRTKIPATEPQRKNYIWKDLGDGNLYIQYNACAEDPELPMETFAAQVAERLNTNQYGRVMVDFRNNGGGSDGVIWPVFYELLRFQQRGGELVALIGEATFSSAIINSVQMQQMGAILVGEPTGGSVSHFGAVQRAQLPNSKLKMGMSTKYIDLGSYYAAAANVGVVSLKPDVLASQSLTAYLQGIDTAVTKATEKGSPQLQATAPAVPSAASVQVNGKPSGLTGYLIGDEHYVAIRDVAAALQGTSAQFDVVWHGDEQAVEVLPGQTYTPVGGELSPLAAGNRQAAPSTALFAQEQMPLQLFGQPGGLQVYRIADRNYLRLRDLGDKLGFQVQWNQANTTVEVTTK